MRTLNNMQQQACKQNTNIYIFIHASPVENTYICGVDLSFIGFIISCGEQFSSIKVVDVDKTNASKWKVVAHYNDTTLCVCVRLSPYFSCYHCVCVYLLFSRIYSTPFEPTIHNLLYKFKCYYRINWVRDFHSKGETICSIASTWLLSYLLFRNEQLNIFSFSLDYLSIGSNQRMNRDDGAVERFILSNCDAFK